MEELSHCFAYKTTARTSRCCRFKITGSSTTISTSTFRLTVVATGWTNFLISRLRGNSFPLMGQHNKLCLIRPSQVERWTAQQQSSQAAHSYLASLSYFSLLFSTLLLHLTSFIFLLSLSIAFLNVTLNSSDSIFTSKISHNTSL